MRVALSPLRSRTSICWFRTLEKASSERRKLPSTRCKGHPDLREKMAFLDLRALPDAMVFLGLPEPKDLPDTMGFRGLRERKAPPD